MIYSTAGVDEETRRAAQTLLSIEEREQVITKEFRRAELAELKGALEARFAPSNPTLSWTKRFTWRESKRKTNLKDHSLDFVDAVKGFRRTDLHFRGRPSCLR